MAIRSHEAIQQIQQFARAAKIIGGSQLRIYNKCDLLKTSAGCDFVASRTIDKIFFALWLCAARPELKDDILLLTWQPPEGRPVGTVHRLQAPGKPPTQYQALPGAMAQICDIPGLHSVQGWNSCRPGSRAVTLYNPHFRKLGSQCMHASQCMNALRNP